MKTALIRTLALVMLASSLSAVAAVASDDEKMSLPCSPAAASTSQSTGDKSQHKKEMKQEKQRMKKEKEQKKGDDNYPGFGIFG